MQRIPQLVGQLEERIRAVEHLLAVDRGIGNLAADVHGRRDSGQQDRRGDRRGDQFDQCVAVAAVSG